MSFELLRAAARFGHGPVSPGLPSGILRFSLEYANQVDVDQERQRLAILLGADGFDLSPLPSGDDSKILLLQFPGIERQQSASFLFSTAQELVDPLGLVSCTPDVDPGWISGDELGRDVPESVGGAVRLLCNSHATPPDDHLWSVRAVGADRAWARFNVRGEGILIGQPDTGVADHRELDDALDIDHGINVVAGGGPPIDPLTEHFGNPGHGTATSSCVVSRQVGSISGTSPSAIVIPVRCVDAVVLGSGASVATAIDHARNVGCHVVTMSLGGPLEFPDLKRAIGRAIDAGMIILAAAGNCVKWVVYPAWDENVIAVAGIDQHDQPWKGSSQGAKVDIAAPAEHVWVASRSTRTDVDMTQTYPGQGTSFSVAVTAGCAALWLSHHKVDIVRAKAAALHTNVQELFRSALKQTARRPAGWPASMGAGVVDAEMLLALDLDAVVVTARPVTGHPMVSELGSAFDWGRFGAEAGFLALDRSQRGDRSRNEALESPIAPRPSSLLRAAVSTVGRDPDVVFGAPAIFASPLTPQLVPGRALRILAATTPGLARSTERANIITERAARSYLEGVGRKDVLDHVESILGVQDPTKDANQSVTELRESIRKAVPVVLDQLAKGVRVRDLSSEDRLAIEAIILMTGRPALRVQDGRINPSDPQIGDWGSDLIPNREVLKPLIDAVGRIDQLIDGRNVHVATGTVVAPGVIMTNRHVMDVIAEPIPAPSGKTVFILTGPVSIAFDETATDPDRRFDITGVLTAGPVRIGQQADIGKLDMALLAMKETNDAGKHAPQPVKVADLREHALPRVLVVGYPARPRSDAVTNPETGTVSVEIWDRLWQLYNNNYGEKFASPGDIALSLGQVAGDTHRWGFSHDATTLAGNSGSSIIGLDSQKVCGLHFGGAPLRQNLAHGLSAVRRAAISEGIIDPAVFAQMLWI